jgi:hypothetical protein
MESLHISLPSIGELALNNAMANKIDKDKH